MKTATQTIPLSNITSERLVKRAALSTFRALRAIGNQSKKVPALIAQAGTDIQSAWQESARQNA
jgi:hypothetical protein